MKKIVLFGASGNIGLQVFEVVNKNRDKFKFVGLSFGHSLRNFDLYLKAFPNIKYIYLPKKVEDCKKYKNKIFFFGKIGLSSFLKISKPDICLNAVGGFEGIKFSFAAIKQNINLALANKETLVCTGPLFNKVLKKSRSVVFPVDSEHATLFNLIKKYKKENIDEFILTASGGAFRDMKKTDLSKVSLDDALCHPTWKMSKKITIDSDTLMNKAYEVVEAFYLFNFAPDKIKVLIEKTSNVHSLIKLKNGNFVAEIYSPTMLVPIENSLIGFEGKYEFVEHDSLFKYKQKFEDPSFERFPLLKFGYEIIKSKGDLNGLRLNAINEVCVNAFLNGKIGFNEIEKIIMNLFKIDNKIYNFNFKELELENEKIKNKTRVYIEENY